MNSEDMFLSGKLRDILIDINNKKDLVRMNQIFYFILVNLVVIKHHLFNQFHIISNKIQLVYLNVK